MRIYVGNLSYRTTEPELREAFAAFGDVQEATVVTDRYTGESRGFGFVEMPNREEAAKAIEELNGKDLGGRAIVVNEARPRRERDDGPRFQGGGRRNY